MPATKQQIRQIIADNNLNSVADVYSLLRDSFKDILQELMEAELDASLGYEKNQKAFFHKKQKTDKLPYLFPLWIFLLIFINIPLCSLFFPCPVPVLFSAGLFSLSSVKVYPLRTPDRLSPPLFRH